MVWRARVGGFGAIGAEAALEGLLDEIRGFHRVKRLEDLGGRGSG